MPSPAPAGGVVGVGTDLVAVERFEGAVRRRPRMLERLLSGDEIAALGTSRPPAAQARSLAARFAAKEAVMKALGVGLGEVAFSDIEILGGRGTAPAVRLSGRAQQVASRLGVDAVAISMTHDASLAAATAVASRRCTCSPS